MHETFDNNNKNCLKALNAVASSNSCFSFGCLAIFSWPSASWHWTNVQYLDGVYVFYHR